MAQLTAVTHGLSTGPSAGEEDADSKPAEDPIKPAPDARLLLPTPPAAPISATAENWPTLSLHKDFFEAAIKVRPGDSNVDDVKTGPKIALQAPGGGMAMDESAAELAGGANWGEDADLGLDGDDAVGDEFEDAEEDGVGGGEDGVGKYQIFTSLSYFYLWRRSPCAS